MTTIGIDLEQFVRDPYATGIQRVLHQLAMNWPNDMAVAEFVVPVGDRFGLLNSAQATELLAIAFTPARGGGRPSRSRQRVPHKHCHHHRATW